MEDQVVIVSATRTPIGAMMGALSSLSAPELAAFSIRAAVSRTNLAPEHIDEVILGCVLPAGQGQSPARQASLGAGLPQSVGATLVNKVCGSGMKAVALGCDALLSNSQNVVVVGGMESMSNAPFLALKARAGYRFGHSTFFDHMALDGLEDAYEKTANGGGKSMGLLAESCASHYQFSREQQDAFAIESTKRAVEANRSGLFQWEMAPITLLTKKGEVTIEQDELPFKSNPERIPSLRPAFLDTGTITAATSSSIADGASALVLMRASTAKTFGITPLARIVAHTSHAHAPNWFTTAPVSALKKLLEKTGWTATSVDLFEINEAFAVVAMAVMQECGLPRDAVNIHGGACALGHPIGASGSRILTTLLGGLRARKKSRGVATLCIGGGEAMAMAVESLL